MKRRVLFVGEASYLATGFSTYWNEVLRRIHATGEFEIAEMGSYAHDADPRCQSVPWKFYPVAPDPRNAEAQRAYMSSQTNQFGEWRFSDVLLDFKPHIVCAIRDWWMDEFILRSPLRDYFKFAWLLTIDGAPQRDRWLDSYRQTDYVLTYSEFGRKVLEAEGRPNTNFVTIASPGADIQTFRPVPDKRAHKSSAGIDPDCFVVGTVMRNQKRKLYYDLIQAYADWFHGAKSRGQIELAKKTFLYLHTSYPDVGYDIGKALREFKVGNRVLMTYMCDACHSAYPSFFAGEVARCRRCGEHRAHPPNADRSVTRDVLAHIMNLFDVYVQYSICEGWGMPVTEAMACGVPAMCVDYSAMQDHVALPGGIPIRVQRFFYEAVIETEQRRALPDNAHFGEQLTKFLRMRPEARAELARRTRESIVEPAPVFGQDEKLPRFGWERTAAIWANFLRTCEIIPEEQAWGNPNPNLVRPATSFPAKEMSNAEFVNWAISNVWCRPDLANSFSAGEMVRSLNAGFRVEGQNMVPVRREDIAGQLKYWADMRNAAEMKRVEAMNGRRENGLCMAAF